MSHTNSTTNYELSQFLGSDKPAWLVDYNGDMLKIDTQMKANADAAAEVAGDVSQLQSEIGSEGLTGRITQAENDIDALETAVGSVELPTTAQTLTGAIAELKGVNDDQTTAIGNNATAIAQVSGNVEGVSQLAYTIANVYDSTATYSIGDYCIQANTLYKCTTAIAVGEAFDSSKWTSVKVMDEMPSGGGGGTTYTAGDGIDITTDVISFDGDTAPYDNTSSGLSATNVQAAIDELAGASPVSGRVIATVTGDGTKKITDVLSEMYTALVNAALTEDQVSNLRLIIPFSAGNPQVFNPSMYHITNSAVDFVRFSVSYYNSNSSWGTSILDIGSTVQSLVCPHASNAQTDDPATNNGETYKLILI